MNERDRRIHTMQRVIAALIDRHGAEDAKLVLDAVGTKEAIALHTRIMATQHARQLLGEGLSPREASYRLADLLGWSVRNARRYTDNVTNSRGV